MLICFAVNFLSSTFNLKAPAGSGNLTIRLLLKQGEQNSGSFGIFRRTSSSMKDHQLSRPML